jgi:hypothetical protein
MDFTFGIITSGQWDGDVLTMIYSIIRNNIPNYEIIIVGNTKIMETDRIRVIEFDETIKSGWITRKKNLIALNAKYENIVLMHDYIMLADDWYSGFLKYGNDFEWCITKIITVEGYRFRDYTLFPSGLEQFNISYSPAKDIDDYFNYHCLLPYDFENTIQTNKYMYISGAYYVIKRNIAITHLLDENLTHCGGEDVEYSKRLHQHGIIIKCNPYSCVQLLKPKEQTQWEKEIDPVYLHKFVSYCNGSSA